MQTIAYNGLRTVSLFLFNVGILFVEPKQWKNEKKRSTVSLTSSGTSIKSIFAESKKGGPQKKIYCTSLFYENK